MAHPNEKIRLRVSNLVNEALYSLPFDGNVDGDTLDGVEGWLDSLASALAKGARVKRGEDALSELIDTIAERSEFPEATELQSVRDDIARIAELANSFEYGVCLLTKKELREAEGCILEIQAVFDDFVTQLRSTAR